MNYGRVLLSLSLLVAAGCQKPAATNEEIGTFNTASVSCESVTTSDGVQIVGESEAQSGSAVSYALAEAGNCVNGQNVSWKVAGASRTLTTSAGLTSIYRKAGSYVVVAQEKTTGAEAVSFQTQVVSTEVAMSAPHIAFTYNDVSFSLVVPASMTVASVAWDFGDGSALQAGISPKHVFYDEKSYTVKATVTDSEGKVTVVSRDINIIGLIDGMECAVDVAISGATETKVKVPTTMSVFIPSCLTSKVGAVRWDFGDGNSASNQTVSHTYNAIGTFPVTATLYLGTSTEPWVTIKHTVRVIENLDVPEEPEEPVNPNACVFQGEKRMFEGELYSEVQACGIDGTKTVTYRDVVIEECQLVVERLEWKETSRTKEKTNEGECQGQSCRLPDGSLLTNGASKILYTSSNPANSCESVSEARTCNNGVLSGSQSANQMTCNNGCGSFGAHGTVKTAVVIGEVKVQKQCQFQEQGIFDIFNQVTDQTCQNGSVVNSNTRQGDIKTAGSCPVYSYGGTDSYSACSADCGGKQTRVFVCRDEKGNQVDNSRCGDQVAPVEERVCDGNPAAVRRQEVTSTTEEANSSKVCPKNQIGVIVKSREVVNTKTYACINHSVQLQSDVSVPSAWVEESFCRDYVARRCSQDSLNNTEAKGRYDWMVKCQNDLPVIKEFLTNFDNVTLKVDGKELSVGGKGRELYPTFMNTAFKPEKPWIAPKVATAPCTMPATAYIATVCVSSCATPEQQILAQEQASGKLKYMPFIEALTKNAGFVASLQSAQSMGSKAVVKTKVDQWVTELIDTEHDILVFKMKSGRELKLTPNHPVVTAEGMMKKAGEFKAGEALVQLGGVLDPIESITPIKHFGKVYNVFVQSNAIHKNILVTNGYLNGSAYFQNEGAKDMNRSLFRQKLTRGVFDK